MSTTDTSTPESSADSSSGDMVTAGMTGKKSAEQIHTDNVKKMCKNDYGDIYKALLIAKEEREKISELVRPLNDMISVCEEAIKIRRTEDQLEN